MAFAASALVGTHGIAYWDAGDYVLLSIKGGQSGLLLGRPLFVWISQLIVAAGVEPAHAEPVLRWFWSAVAATGAPAMAVLAVRLGLARDAAFAAGAALAMSPSFAHTSHQVLTDAPALALSLAALAAAASGHAVRAGAILAAAVATRETAAVHLVAIALLLDSRQAGRAVASCAAALIAIVLVHQPQGLFAWFQTMSSHGGGGAWGGRDLLTSVVWVFAAGPLPVIAGIVALARHRADARVRAVAVPAILATILLLFYPDGSFSPRYVLAVVPVAFFILAGPWLAARPALCVAALVLPLVVAGFAAGPANAVARQGATLTDRIPQMPRGAIVVPGHFCPQARIAATIAQREDLEFVCPGWDWPADLAARLDVAAREGKPVAVDIAENAWVGPREIGPRDAVRAWASTRSTTQLAGFAVIKVER